ncbi:MAG: hypothetical protein COS90_10730 [Deltaproteobacteria bacterium CG07_land_8_20_14_0_80_60_11]|nr:MAG: hypothetical protein COS90_10730 [Deltaproteobacteria bacterium CG07_land_8_20_14_0_80_60_11]
MGTDISAKMTEKVWKAVGGAGPGLQEIVNLARQDGVNFPLPSEVLRFVKGFMQMDIFSP